MSKTVKVRIAVSVDPSGKWYACGYTDMDISDAHDSMDVSIIGYGERRYWVEAELELPEIVTVEGTAEATS